MVDVDERLNWLVSVDDHVLEPPHVWQARVAEKFRDAAPQLIRNDKGEFWQYDGKVFPTTGLSAAAGKKKEEFSPLPVRYDEMRPGCYDPKARIEDMDRAGVLASLCFPSFPRFCGQTFYEANDRELALVCVQAYNDWMIEEWCGAAPGRLIPLIILPLWDPKRAAVEIERCAGKGAKAITFSENPASLGLPSIHDKDRYWDPVFAAASATGMPLCTHIGSGSKLPSTAPDSPLILTVALTPRLALDTCMDWLFSGNLERFPNLKLALSEGGISWMPYVLQLCDHTLERQGAWAAKGDLSLLGAGGGGAGHDYQMAPSEVFRRQVFGCFILDPLGVDLIDRIGVDNVMVETDYPHTDSTWPDSIEVARKQLASLSEDDQYKVMQGNARRVFNFEPATPPNLAR